MATVTLPGIGAVDQKYVYAGGAVVAGIVGYAWWRRSQEPPPASWADVDPADLIPSTEHVSPGGGSNLPPSTGDGRPLITTNDQWAAAATDRLSSIGYTPQFVAEALGAFLARQDLSALQAAAVLAAKAQLGEPPVGGPWPVKVKGPSGGDGGEHTPLGAVTNLRATGSTRNTITLAWNAVPGATNYVVRVGGQGGQPKNWPAGWDSTTGTTYTVSGLPYPGTAYWISVNAERGTDSGGQARINASTSG